MPSNPSRVIRVVSLLPRRRRRRQLRLQVLIPLLLLLLPVKWSLGSSWDINGAVERKDRFAIVQFRQPVQVLHDVNQNIPVIVDDGRGVPVQIHVDANETYAETASSVAKSHSPVSIARWGILLRIDQGKYHLWTSNDETVFIPGMHLGVHSIEVLIYDHHGKEIISSQSVHKKNRILFELVARCPFVLQDVTKRSAKLHTSIVYGKDTEIQLFVAHNETVEQASRRTTQDVMELHSYRPFIQNLFESGIVNRKAARQRFRQRITEYRRNGQPLRIILGAIHTVYPGWINTNRNILDVTVNDDFKEFFDIGEVSAMLAEHVWEHLSLAEGIVAAANCFEFLREGGYLRLAVPDHWRSPENATAFVLAAEMRYEHKVMYNIDLLVAVLKSVGFHVMPLEYHTDQAKSVLHPWDAMDGNITRSSKFDRRGPVSIIVDAIKVLKSHPVESKWVYPLAHEMVLHLHGEAVLSGQGQCERYQAEKLLPFVLNHPTDERAWLALTQTYAAGGHPALQESNVQVVSLRNGDVVAKYEPLQVGLRIKDLKRVEIEQLCVVLDDYDVVHCTYDLSETVTLRLGSVNSSHMRIRICWYYKRPFHPSDEPTKAIDITLYAVQLISLASRSMDLRRLTALDLVQLEHLLAPRGTRHNFLFMIIRSSDLCFHKSLAFINAMSLCAHTTLRRCKTRDLRTTIQCLQSFTKQSLLDWRSFIAHDSMAPLMQVDEQEFLPLILLRELIRIYYYDDHHAIESQLPASWTLVKQVQVRAQERLPTEEKAKRSPRNVVHVAFFTLVLNGQPFIQHHIHEFNRLNNGTDSLAFAVLWEWHVVEGVALHRAHRSRPYSTKTFSNEFTTEKGRSVDGTCEYLNWLSTEYPDQVFVHAPPPLRNEKGWLDKLEMVNHVLGQVTFENGYLFQIDVDELWTSQQLWDALQLMESNRSKMCAYFHCHFFITDKLLTQTRNAYSHNNEYEWLRLWRYRKGMIFLDHAPPTLVDWDTQSSRWLRLKGGDLCFSHDETEARGLVFTHHAYTSALQVRFKEEFYGYVNAYQEWELLRQVQPTAMPVDVGRYLSWVPPGTFADVVEKRTIGRNVPVLRAPRWSNEDFIDDKWIEPPFKVNIVLDTVIFQNLDTSRYGIGRVWKEILEKMMQNLPLNYRVILLLRCLAKDEWAVRNKIHSLIQESAMEVIYKRVPLYDPFHHERDAEMLHGVCLQYKARRFLSTLYTYVHSTCKHSLPSLTSPFFKSILLLHDLIPEKLGWPQMDGIWKARRAAMLYAHEIVTVSMTTKQDYLVYYPQGLPSSQVHASWNGLSTQHFYPRDPRSILAFRKRFRIFRKYILVVGKRGGYKHVQLLYQALRHYANVVVNRNNKNNNKNNNNNYYYENKTENKSENKENMNKENMNKNNVDNFVAPPLLVLIGPSISEAWEISSLMGIDYIRIATYLSDEDLAVAYSGAQALLYLSLYEGFGLPVAEAMACGCPVLATASPAVREVAQHAAWYISDVLNVSSLCFMLQDVMNATENERLRSKVRAYAERHLKSWHVLAHAISNQLLEE